MNRKQRRANKGKENHKKTTPVTDPLWAVFQEGLQHQGAGRFNEAEQIYKKILQINPAHAHSLHMMGLMAFDLKKYDVAEEFVKKAIKEHSDVALFHSTLGNTFKAQAKYEEAAVHYRKALEFKPDFVDVLSNLGAILLNFNKNEEALELFRKVLVLNPAHFSTLNNIGIISQERKEYNEARQYFERAIMAKPDSPEAYKNLGLLLKRAGNLKEAIVYFEKAIELRPNYVDAMSDLANALRDERRYDEAKKYYERIVELRPDGFALANIASILKQQGKISEAIAYFGKALTLSPEDHKILNNLGMIQTEIGSYKEAVATYKKAISLDPTESLMLSNLGTALKNMGQVDESLEYFKKAILLSSEKAVVYSNLLLTMVYASSVSPEELMEAAKNFGDAVGSVRKQRPFLNEKNPDRKLRIGYVSPDYCNHSVNYFFEDLLKLHDRSQFEVYAYSNTLKEDIVTERLRQDFDHWRDIRYVSDNEAADMIEADKIDILIDISGHTGRNRLLIFAIKPAPVQVTWLGYPATTGLAAMDYRITDVYAEPEGMTEHLNTEKLYRMPDIFCCCKPNESSPAVIDHPPFEDNGFVTFGCFNNFSKVTDEVMGVWAKVMERIPDSRLLLEIAGIQEPEFRSDVVQRLERNGLSIERVILEQRKQSNQFILYNRIDIALDPFPCNGGTTSFDTLWMGVPLVTLVGKHFVSRMGVTILTNGGMSELIAKDVEEYIKIAADLAADRKRLKELRSGLRERIAASPLMDQKRFVQNMEVAYRDMWRNWCAET